MSSTDSLDVEKLNEKLDTYAVEMIECYQDLLAERVLLEKFLKDGFLNMSKARSIMGCASLSRLQIPENTMTAQVRVNEYADESKDDVKANRFDLIRETGMPMWIGPFSPLSLKNSQKDFSRTLDIIVSLAEKQNRLRGLIDAYNRVSKEKLKS